MCGVEQGVSTDISLAHEWKESMALHGPLLTIICNHLENQSGNSTIHQESGVCKVCSPSVLEKNPHGPEEACGGTSLSLKLLQRALGDGSPICLQKFLQLALVALL